jgi:magnesium chelatase family protein
MFTKITAATTVGIQTHHIEVEVDLSFGMLQFNIVGLPDAAIRESKQRIMTAIKQCGIRIPERKITVNLAPADIKKEGTLFDLPIALGILHAAEIIHLDAQFLQETLFLGELSLDGSIKPVKGVLPIAHDSVALGKRRMIVSPDNAEEASLSLSMEVIAARHLTELVAYIRGEMVLVPTKIDLAGIHKNQQQVFDLSDIKGQHVAKRALCIAAAGRHNIMMIGSPGSGKTMLAQRLVQLLPPLTFHEMVETSKIYSVSGKLLHEGLIKQRPFRAPHHTISTAGLVGGGSFPQPGEVSLAHHGVLFLDELTEFKTATIEVLRQPLEQRIVHIARAQHTVSFPASFVLVAAMNPCPCGFLDDRRRPCTCAPQAVQRYRARLSGPILDRIDLQVPVHSMSYDMVESSKKSDVDHVTIATEIARAHAIQRERLGDEGRMNGHMTSVEIERWCILSEPAQHIVRQSFDKLGLTMRGYHKLLKVARTIADLNGSSIIEATHLQEAMSYRSIDRMRDMA